MKICKFCAKEGITTELVRKRYGNGNLEPLKDWNRREWCTAHARNVAWEARRKNPGKPKKLEDKTFNHQDEIDFINRLASNPDNPREERIRILEGYKAVLPRCDKPGVDIDACIRHIETKLTIHRNFL